MSVKCPECGERYNIEKPRRAGNHHTLCPKCGFESTIQVLPKIIGKSLTAADEPVTNIPTQMPLKMLGRVEMSAGKYVIKNPAIIGKVYSLICPKCNKSIAIRPKEAGEKNVTCNFCNSKIFFNVVAEQPVVKPIVKPVVKPVVKPAPIPQPVPEPQPVPQPTPTPQPVPQPKVKQLYDDIEVTIIELPHQAPQPEPVVTPQPFNGRLLWGIKPNRKTTILNDGTTIIGRKDPEYPSDIQFEDEEMSRQSVRIDVTHGATTNFTLTVQKSTNPVVVNGKRLTPGASMILPNGSSIRLGRTILVFRND